MVGKKAHGAFPIIFDHDKGLKIINLTLFMPFQMNNPHHF